MDSIVCTALEEICCEGNTGIPLVSLWSRLSPPPLSPSVKSHVWRNLLSIPQLQFKAKNTVYGSSDPSIQLLEDAHRLDLRIIANEKLRGNFVGLYDAQSNNTTISAVQRRVLERLAVARSNGVAQNLLAKEFNIQGRNFFYIVKQLESRGLIVRQPAIVRTKEVDGEGDSKTTSCVSTNMIYLSSYSKPLGSQQRFEICKEDPTAPGEKSTQSEITKEDTLIKDFLPAMQAICDKLEEANDKVLVVSDVKQDLGYLGSHSRHRAWRSVCRRLTESHIVEEFDAVVNNKVERCLRLLKSFSEKDFTYCGKKQFLKFGRSTQKTEQTLELPIDNQIYDMVDAEGSKGLAVMEVCERLGIDKKKSYSRLHSICSRVGMHLQAESHKKTTVYRVWTSRNAGTNSTDLFPDRAETISRESNIPTNDSSTPHVTGGLAQPFIEHSLAVADADFATPPRLTDSECNSGQVATPGRLTDSERSSGVLHCSPSNATGRNVLACRNLQESFHEIGDKVVDTAMGSADLALSEMNHLVLPKPSKPKMHQQLPITVENARRERRILERLNEEKFVLRAELHKWLVSLEKDRSTKVDRKTIDRLLRRLQQEGLCECMAVSVPNVTNCGRNRSSVVVLHPSVQRLTPEEFGVIHDKIRSFELGLRGQSLSKRKNNEPIPILNDIQRGQSNVDLDARASKSGAMRANGFVLAKMVRVKLLHCFLWDYFSSLPGWDNAFSSSHDHKFENLFALEDAFRAMPLELFLQVVGSTQKADDMMKKCKQGMRLSELPSEEYKLLMDTLATGRLSMLIDILRRLKLIQMVSNRFRHDEIEEKYANLTHAMELMPYIEEPVFVAATPSVMSLDLRPRIRHDFILSNRDAVDEYWLTLEYCYAAADHRAAKQAFPGSVVQEVFRFRSWASDCVMTAEQRAMLLKRIATDEKEKLSFKECEKIAKDLNLSLEQVMHVYHAKRGRRLKSKDKNHAVENSPSPSSGKRKRETPVKTTGKGVRSKIIDEQNVLNSDAIDASNSEDIRNTIQEDQTHIRMNQQENEEIRDLTENEGQCSSLINQYASSKTASTPAQRFSWTDAADRKLLSQYVRHRAALGAKFHGVNWAQVRELPAPPLACKRRTQTLMKNDKFRKAVLRLCNILSERYAKHLETKQKCLPESSSSHVLVRTDSGFVEHGKDIFSDDEKWDDFSENSICQAFDDILELKKMAKLVAPKRAKPSSREWSNRDIVDEGSETVPPAIRSDDIENPSVDQVKDTSRRSGHYRFHQTINPLDGNDNGNIQVRKSLAVSTAVELLKLVFLSMPTAPGMPNLLEDTLRRYSERDLFTAYSYLRDKKFLVGGSGGQPFVLSQNFLHSISKSPFPVNTGTRAAKFSRWLLENERDLMAGGVALTSDLQCGDVLNFFSLVSSGELSISVSLPEEGVGEPGDRRGLKRRSDEIEESEADSAKKQKLLGEGEINFRKEKGFPGIAVSVRRVTLPTANAIELFKDDDSRTGELHCKELSLRALNQNGDPLGRRDLGRNVVKWISQAMKAMASDFANAEVQGEFSELRQNVGSGLTFVIQAQPYLNAIPMPLGLEVICMKACTHYPTLFDHFQRELRDVLQDLESKNVMENWKETQSWKLLKEIANSAHHREVARKAHQPKPVAGVFGMDSEKVKAIQARIDEFTSRMSQLLQVERDTELEVTQEELDVIPTPDESSDSSKPIEFLVRHGEAPQELCDTICNLYAVSTSTGLGGMHLVLFKVGGNHRLPPTTLSPGDMVCIRICDSKGAGATSCTQGFVHNLGDDGCSIGVALESRHGDPTFSKLFGKSVRIDRIHGLADALTYERNCEALMLLQKNGLQKKNPSISVVATLFGDGEDITWLEQNDYVDWSEAELSDEPVGKLFDDSQRRAIALGVNKKRPVMIVQGPPGTGKTGMLKEVITLAVQQGERVLVTAPTNAAVDNMVEKLSHLGLNIVRVGNPARISSAVASKSLGEIVNSKLASFRTELERKKSDLRKDLRQCLRDDSLAAGIRQLLKQLGKALKKKEKETVKEILSNAQVVFATNIGAADPLVRRLETFDLVVIDEAGQSIEPSCWIPILQGKRCILAGDPCQLAPVVLSRKALEDGLGVSLLERAASLHDGLLATKLTTQYRMNDAIAGWASKEMYGGWLKSAPSVASHLLIDSPFVKPTWITQCPLLLLDTRMPYGSLSMGCEERLDPAGTGSLYNEGEADIVVNHVISLIYAGVSPMAIAVQSPYVAQVQLLRERLDDFPVADGVEVATIDSFQGREADAVIISMVRSNNLGAVGFLGDSRRMNVAITRARKHVAVVCDSSTICHNTFLARLLRHIRYFGRVKHVDPGSLGGSGLGLDPMLPYLG